MKRTGNKKAYLKRQGLAFLLAMVIILSAIGPVGAVAVTEETTVPTTTGETVPNETQEITPISEGETTPAQETTAPTEETAAPTVETTAATEAVTEATEAETEATEAATEATEAVTEATEAVTEATEAVTEPTEETTETTEEATEPTEETVPETTEETVPAVDFDAIMATFDQMYYDAAQLDGTMEALDAFFFDRLEVEYTKAQELWTDGLITDQQLAQIEERTKEIQEYLMDAYGYIAEFGGKSEVEVLDADASAQEGDKIVVPNNQGIKFRLFNYSDYINMATDGQTTNKNPISKVFRFSGNPENADFNVTALAGVDDDGFTKGHSSVENTLDANGYPVLNITRNADGTAKPDVTDPPTDLSLRYLFDNTGFHAVKEHPVTNTILQKQGDRYIYNSMDNAVDYDPDKDVFRVRNYTERNSSTAGYKSNLGRSYGDFLPFNYTGGTVLGQTTISGTEQKANYHIANADVDYWFGMTMEVDFYMPENGQVNGQDMKFTFSGDDDVWVFVDDVLVLDLGGTHGTVKGVINFATGEVQQYLDWAASEGQDGTVASDTSFPTSLEERFSAAGKNPNGDWGTNGDAEDDAVFKNYTKHKLKFFYLERGSGVANCSLDFNLPALPSNSLTVGKSVDTEPVDGYTVDPNKDYTFTVKLTDTTYSQSTPIKNATYKIANGSAQTVTSETGEYTFTMKAGQTAEFQNLRPNTAYEVSEKEEHGFKVIYTNDRGTIINEGVVAGVTNQVVPASINLQKEVTGNMGDLSKDFTFTAKLKRTAGGTDYVTFPTAAVPAGGTLSEDGMIITVNMKDGQKANFSTLPVGTILEISEDNAGYDLTSVVHGADVITPTEGSTTVEVAIDDTNGDVVYTNNKNVPIDTGISLNSYPFILLLSTTLVAAFVLLMGKVRYGREY